MVTVLQLGYGSYGCWSVGSYKGHPHWTTNRQIIIHGKPNRSIYINLHDFSLKGIVAARSSVWYTGIPVWSHTCSLHLLLFRLQHSRVQTHSPEQKSDKHQYHFQFAHDKVRSNSMMLLPSIYNTHPQIKRGALNMWTQTVRIDVRYIYIYIIYIYIIYIYINI